MRTEVVKNMFSVWLGHTVTFLRHTLSSLESLSGYGRMFDPENPDPTPENWEYL